MPNLSIAAIPIHDAEAIDSTNYSYSPSCAPTSANLPPKPIPPTSSLPPLLQLTNTSAAKISSTLVNLRMLYWPPPLLTLSKNIILPKRNLPKHFLHGSTSIPDSGYASADEDEDDEEKDDPVEACTKLEQCYGNTDAALEVLRADPFERGFAIKWLTGFIARSDTWIDQASSDGDFIEVGKRTLLLEEATMILSAFTADEEEEAFALTRSFEFPLIEGTGKEERTLKVELNDAPVSNNDYTSVGLQSWGSSILLAEKMATSPFSFSLSPSSHCGGKPLRMLELGAGTGLLSIVSAKLLAGVEPKPTIVATDYHPDVLGNLQRNIQTNFLPSSLHSGLGEEENYPVMVKCLDWEHPQYDEPLHERFDIILAADVVYQQEHTSWIKTCVEKLLRLPRNYGGDGTVGSMEGGIFWLMIPLRTAGRHEGMCTNVDGLFPDGNTLLTAHSADISEPRLVILEKQDIGRQTGVGRADECGYKLFKIGWAS